MVAFNLALELAILVLAGWVTRKLKVVGEGFETNLSKFILSVSLPCLLIDMFSGGFDAEQLGNLLIIIAITVGLCLVGLFVFGTLLYKLLGGGEIGRVARFAVMYPNFTFMGIPVVQALYGDVGLLYFNIMLIPVRLVYYISIKPLLMPAEAREKSNVWEALKNFVSPVTVSLVIGLILFFTGITLPEFLANAVSALSDTASPLGMVMCGMILAGINIKELFSRPKILIITLLRLFAVPALALLAVYFLPVDVLVKKIVIMYCAMPSAALLATFAVRYCATAEGREAASVVVFSTTALSVATLPLWYALMEAIF